MRVKLHCLQASTWPPRVAVRHAQLIARKPVRFPVGPRRTVEKCRPARKRAAAPAMSFVAPEF